MTRAQRQSVKHVKGTNNHTVFVKINLCSCVSADKELAVLPTSFCSLHSCPVESKNAFICAAMHLYLVRNQTTSKQPVCLLQFCCYDFRDPFILCGAFICSNTLLSYVSGTLYKTPSTVHTLLYPPSQALHVSVHRVEDLEDYHLCDHMWWWLLFFVSLLSFSLSQTLLLGVNEATAITRDRDSARTGVR
jgi:hypothetical protein